MDGYDRTTGEILPKPSIGAMPPPIAAAIVRVMKSAKQLGFDERNQHGGYSYVSIDKFLDAFRPLMAEAGLMAIVDEADRPLVEIHENKDKRTAWLLPNYEIWLIHETGAVWGPLKRSLALPLTGPQTFAAAESFILKRLLRGLFMVPAGEKDADDIAPIETVPTTRGATRVASPNMPPPSPTMAATRSTPSGRPAGENAATPNATSADQGPSDGHSSTSNGTTPKWIAGFLARKSYEIDPTKLNGWSDWEKVYLSVCDNATDIDQVLKLENDNGAHFPKFREVVRPEVYEHFRSRIEANEKRLWKEPTSLASVG